MAPTDPGQGSLLDNLHFGETTAAGHDQSVRYMTRGLCAGFRVLLLKADAMGETEVDALVGGSKRDSAEGR